MGTVLGSLEIDLKTQVIYEEWLSGEAAGEWEKLSKVEFQRKTSPEPNSAWMLWVVNHTAKFVQSSFIFLYTAAFSSLWPLATLGGINSQELLAALADQQ